MNYSASSTPLVSICCVTYNHDQFIEQCLNGFVSQQTDFAIEILVHEDASTDRTAKIVREYETKYPHLFRCVYQSINQFKLQNTLTNILLPMARGKYIALCEGDDYWTDRFKLKKQVDFLEANPGIAGCFHDVVTVDKDGNLLKTSYYRPHKEIFNQVDCLTYGGAYATCSLVCRAMVFNAMPQWFLKLSSDYAIDLLITEFGDIAYLAQNMGAYRIHPGGVWQGNVEGKNWESVIPRYQACLTNPEFKKKYRSFFYGRIAELSSKVAVFYKNEKKYLQGLKYICYYIYYGRPNNLRSFQHLLGVLMFPSIYKSIKSLLSRPTK